MSEETAPKAAAPTEAKPLRVNIDDLDIDYTEACYQGVPFTGIGYERHRDGSLIAEVEYRNGLELGWARNFYPDGRLESEYRRGVYGPEGVAREWFPDGRLSRETFYERGIALSKKGWDEQGASTYEWHLTEGDPEWARLQGRKSPVRETADEASAGPAA